MTETDRVVDVDRDDRGVLTVTLGRPDAANAISDAMVVQLLDTFNAAASDESVRAIVLTGHGRSFCAGGDIASMSAMAGWTYDENVADSNRFNALFRAIDECPHPVVCSANGGAYGGGVGLVACADIAIAVDSATFGLSEVRIGIIPAVVSTYVVPKLGLPWSRRMVLTGERIDAVRAMSLGLVHEIVPAERLVARTAELVELLLVPDIRAQRRIKRHMIDNWQTSPNDRDRIAAAAAHAASAARTSPEGVFGMGAFLAQAAERAKR